MPNSVTHLSFQQHVYKVHHLVATNGKYKQIIHYDLNQQLIVAR